MLIVVNDHHKSRKWLANWVANSLIFLKITHGNVQKVFFLHRWSFCNRIVRCQEIPIPSVNTVKPCKNITTTPMMHHLSHIHPILINGSSSSSQSTITSVLARSCDPQRADKIRTGICKLIKTDILPMSIVDGKGFANQIYWMEPAYRIPSRRTVTRLIETQYEERKELFKKLVTAECFSHYRLLDSFNSWALHQHHLPRHWRWLAN